MNPVSVKPITGRSAAQKNPQANRIGRLQPVLYGHNTAVKVNVAASGSHQRKSPGSMRHKDR